MERTKYVSTLLVNEAFTHAAFLTKNRPAFLADKLCPVGGRMEPGELPCEAASREHDEETGVYIKAAAWRQYCQVERADAVMYCFYAIDDAVFNSKTMTDEPVEVLPISEVLARASNPATAHLVSKDMISFLGLVLRSRSEPGITVMFQDDNALQRLGL